MTTETKHGVARITERCPAHPNPHVDAIDPSHECLRDEMRCAYCGVRLAPYPCHQCGRFLTAKRMHEAALGEPYHCEECTS